jgi:hypothetical protein
MGVLVAPEPAAPPRARAARRRIAPVRVAPAAPAAPLGSPPMDAAAVAMIAMVFVLGPIVLVALGGLATLWIGSRYARPHHNQIHDHEVND